MSVARHRPGLFAAVVIAWTLFPLSVRADHPCSPDPAESIYDPLCEQEGEVDCDPKNPSTCVECWDCIDNDGDGLFDCQDELDAEGNVNINGGCAAYCGFVGPDGEGPYDQDADGDGFLDCPIGLPDPVPSIYDCDDAECLVHPDALELCGDALDNDCDGLVDADDVDCVGSDDDDSAGSDDDDDPDCDTTNPLEFDCTNLCDDDNDGLLDCEDVEDCGADPACDGFSGGDDPCAGDDDDDSTSGPGDDDSSGFPGDDDSGPWSDDDDVADDDDSGDDDAAGDDDDASGDDDISGGDDDVSDDDDESGSDARRQGCNCSWTGPQVGIGLGLTVLLFFGVLFGRRGRFHAPN